MEILGTFQNFIKRNEKTGESTFYLALPDSQKAVLCEGICIFYSRYTPLKVVGSYTTDDVFKVQQINLTPISSDTTSVFLAKSRFDFIGEDMAMKMVEELGYDFMDKLTSEDVVKSMSERVSKTSKYVEKCLLDIYGLKVQEKTYDHIRSLGGSYYSASRLFDQFALNVFRTIENNPYTMLIFGEVPLKICDKVASEYGLKSYDKKRMHAVVLNAMRRNRNSGNTRIEFRELVKLIEWIEKSEETVFKSKKIFIAEELCSSAYSLSFTDRRIYAYLADDAVYEDAIVENIGRIQQSAVSLDMSHCSIDAVEKALNISYSDEQRNAFKLLDRSGIKILEGGPGTGKTTFIRGLLAMYRTNYVYNGVTLCAPTGNAAKRLRDATGYPAETCHKTIKLTPFSKENMITEQLLSDIWIIDEGSMVDEELFSYLLRCVKNGALVILSGDEHQIASVGPGNVFSDLLKSGKIETYHFTHIFRQDDSRSAIISNSKKILAGDANLTEAGNFHLMRFEDEKVMVETAVSLSSHDFLSGLDTQVFTPSRNPKFYSGSVNLNRLIQKSCMKAGENPDSIVYGDYRFVVGDRILFNRNNYEKKYFNGQEGKITKIEKKGRNFYVTLRSDDSNITLSGGEIDDIDLNYAKTAHKSQGGEWDDVIIVCPNDPKSLMLRQLLYVEVTRAKKSVKLLYEGNALKKTIGNYMEKSRVTGLKDALRLKI